MRAFALAVALALLPACSGPHSSNVTEATADVNAAAARAQGDIDTYAANSLSNAPVNAPAPAPTVNAKNIPPANVAEQPVADDGAQGAADVAQRYFALIEAKRYADAWGLWDDGGRASGMTQRQFVDSFAKYAEYHAEVGAPGRVDAGAGQRYVEVPVRAYGTLADAQRPFAMRGTVTLHRTADIDGASAEQKSWHIRDSSLRPRPDTAAAARTDSGKPSYNCAGTTRVSGRDDGVDPTDRAAGGVWRRGGDSAPIRCSTGG